MTKLEQFCGAIREFEGWYAGSKAWRNNNPGNLRWSKFQAGQRDGFSYFNTAEDGWKALVFDVGNKCLGNTKTGLGPNSTIRQFFDVWAPTSDNNYPAGYSKFVAGECGLASQSLLSEVHSIAPGITQRVSVLLANFEGNEGRVTDAFEDIIAWLKTFGVNTDIRYAAIHTEDPPTVEILGAAGPNNEIRKTPVADPIFVRNAMAPYIGQDHFAVFCYRSKGGQAFVELTERVNGAVLTQLPVMDVSDAKYIAFWLSHEIMHGWHMRAWDVGFVGPDDTHKHLYKEPRPEASYDAVVKKLLPFAPGMFSAAKPLPEPTAIDQQKIKIMQAIVNLLKQAISLVLKERSKSKP